MTRKTNEILSQKERQAYFAPETHNSEQTDYASQAQRVAAQAKEHRRNAHSPTESMKVASGDAEIVAGSESDLIDTMREMEDTGEIDRGAFEGEPDHDDRSKPHDS